MRALGEGEWPSPSSSVEFDDVVDKTIVLYTLMTRERKGDMGRGGE
jgi:hypothetical protein